jgi:hypothetical protein
MTVQVFSGQVLTRHMTVQVFSGQVLTRHMTVQEFSRRVLTRHMRVQVFSGPVLAFGRIILWTSSKTCNKRSISTIVLRAQFALLFFSKLNYLVIIREKYDNITSALAILL